MNANSFPDGRRGRARTGDTARVAEYAASTLPMRGPGMVGRRFPGGSTVTALPVRRAAGTRASILPLTVVDASAKDKDGNPHPGRVRVYKGRLCGRLPTEMHLLDQVMPNGTDNQCYVTCPEGTAYVYGKALADKTRGLFLSSSVYQVASQEDPDGTYLYLLIATVLTTDGKPAIFKEWQGGNWNPAAVASPDKDNPIIYPVGA